MAADLLIIAKIEGQIEETSFMSEMRELFKGTRNGSPAETMRIVKTIEEEMPSF